MKRLLLTFIAMATLAAGCGGPAVSPDGTSRLTGEVAFDGRTSGAPPAVVEVVLVDTADPDSRVGPLGRERIDDPGRTPVPFALKYSVRSVQAGHSYGLCARALDAAGNVAWQSEAPTPVDPPTDEPVRVVVTRHHRNWVDCRWE